MPVPAVVLKVGQNLAPAAKDLAFKAAPVIKDFAVKNAPIVRDAAIKAAPFVYDPAKRITQKAIRKATRTNERGEKILKYDLVKLTDLLRKHNITPEMFSYISNELILHERIIYKQPVVFDNLFKKLIKIKDMEKDRGLINEYELARDTWIKKENNHNTE